MKTIKVKYFNKDLEKLNKIAIGDWIDLRAAKTVSLKKGEYALIPLGIAVELPPGYEANIVPRSSTYKNFKVLQTNSFAVIDESYCGDDDQWHFPCIAMEDTTINFNDRICQFRINKKMEAIEILEVESLGNKNRGGIGSTGVK